MKTSSLFLSVAIVTLATTLARATKCTTDELTTIASIYSSATSKGTAVCPDLMSTTDITASDYCSNSDCLQFMSDMLDGFPDCSSCGVNLKKEAMTIGVYMSYDGCDNLRFYYGILPLSTTNLNSDACVNDKNGYVKYYLVDSSAPLRGCVGELLPHHDWRVYQGREAAAELEDGPYTVELIVHRHDLADGGKGVCEHLNETEAVFYSVAKKHITKSIVVRGNFVSKHGMCSLWLKIESQFFRPLTVYRKSMANEMKAKVPWLTIGKFPPSVDLTTVQDCV
ncbi:hypothetical protein PR003_g27424 [Phytophthora rubi]|uniref:Uncharacterized protein n=1 Tax=Phytophthora rubi TaxID=129364 RepID=A0A6A4C2M2_9STRA|nr:hypothetical protein PR003_g27424 [Phytophthora rubi]